MTDNPTAPLWANRGGTLATRHFGGKTLPLASVLFALAGQEHSGEEGDAMQAAGELLRRLFDMASDAPELNMRNYDHDQVKQLNADMIEIWQLLKEAVGDV